MKKSKLLITATLAVGMTLGSLNYLPVSAAVNGAAAQVGADTKTQQTAGTARVTAGSAQIVSDHAAGARVVKTLKQGSTIGFTAIVQTNGQTWYQVGTNEWIAAAGLAVTTQHPVVKAQQPATQSSQQPATQPAEKPATKSATT